MVVLLNDNSDLHLLTYLHCSALSRARKLLFLISEPNYGTNIKSTQFLGKALKQEMMTCFSKSGDQIMKIDGQITNIVL